MRGLLPALQRVTGDFDFRAMGVQSLGVHYKSLCEHLRQKNIVLSQPLSFRPTEINCPLCFAPSIRSIRYDLRSFDSIRSSIRFDSIRFDSIRFDAIRFDSIRSRRKTKWTVDFSWPKTEGLR